MLPRPFRVRKVRRELLDTVSLELVAEGGDGVCFKPGQFNMLYVFGIGDVPISISGDPADGTRLVHTSRAVGAVTKALGGMKADDMVGVRGPFGTPWPLEAAFSHDLVMVAGGIGLAPLRPALYYALANRNRFGRVTLLYGARTPDDLLFRKELDRWRTRFGTEVCVIVDRATSTWNGGVGMVTKLLVQHDFNAPKTTAFVCGPEVMMRYIAMALEKKDVPRAQIWLSMERNMKCACGLCGHCQWGAHFVCKDGPVFRYDRIAKLFAISEI